MTKFIAISDTHCQLDKVIVPEGDVLIHAGDLTYRGNLQELLPELDKLAEIKFRFKHIILICGNHDFSGEKEPGLMANLCKERNLTWLNHASIQVENIKIFGSPYSPKFGRWAYGLERGDVAKAKWMQIPDNTDIIISHGPPMGILDKTAYTNENVGCADLFQRILEIKPKVHIFGHIHETYGEHWYKGTHYINASICNLDYQPINPPITFEL